MPFARILKDLVTSTPGAAGAILADWEGESVAHFSMHDDEYDLKVVGAHKGIILNQLKILHAACAAGTVLESVITTGHHHFLIIAVGEDYSLVVTMERNAILGRAIYEARKALELLQKEIYGP